MLSKQILCMDVYLKVYLLCSIYLIPQITRKGLQHDFFCLAKKRNIVVETKGIFVPTQDLIPIQAVGRAKTSLSVGFQFGKGFYSTPTVRYTNI